MVSSNATSFTETVLAAVKKSGQRAVLASGWGGLAGEEGPQSEQIFFLRQAPHGWVFSRMSAAGHHGGAGTTAAAVRGGIPSVIVPFYGGQPFWARCLNLQGGWEAASAVGTDDVPRRTHSVRQRFLYPVARKAGGRAAAASAGSPAGQASAPALCD